MEKLSNISLRFNCDSDDKPSSINKKRNLLIGLISAAQLNIYVDSLQTGISKDALQQSLIDVPYLKSRSSIHEMFDFLHHEGTRTAYSILLPHLLSIENPKEAEETIRKRFFGIELFIEYTRNLYQFLNYLQQENSSLINKKDLERGILAWDMAELINTGRMAYETGYIDETTAWQEIDFAGRECRKTFNSWEEVGKSYLIGHAMKSNKKEEWDIAIEYFILALEDKKSPWKNIIFHD